MRRLRAYYARHHATRALKALRIAFPAVAFDVVSSPFPAYAFRFVIRATRGASVSYVGRGPLARGPFAGG